MERRCRNAWRWKCQRSSREWLMETAKGVWHSSKNDLWATGTFIQLTLAVVQKWPRCQHTISLSHTITEPSPAQLRSILTSVAAFLHKQSMQHHRCEMHTTYMQLCYAWRSGKVTHHNPYRPASIHNLFFLHVYDRRCVLKPAKLFGVWGWQTSTTFKAFFLSNSPT